MKPRAVDGRWAKKPEDVASRDEMLRFRDKYRSEDRGYKTPCWVWGASTNKGGYGRFMTKERVVVLAHRWSYKTFVGELRKGEQIDHLCRIRACVNPDHLESVSQVENIRRGQSSKLTASDVEQIRLEHAELLRLPTVSGRPRRSVPKGSLSSMCGRWGISQYHLRDILLHKKWADDPWLERRAA